MQLTIDNYQLTISLIGKVVPKARPRFSRGSGAYLPKRYRDWKNDAIAIIQHQLPEDWEPLERCQISIAFLGKHNKNGDLDNLAGAILDALVGAGAVLDDRLSIVRSLSLEFLDSKKPPETMISLLKM